MYGIAKRLFKEFTGQALTEEVVCAWPRLLQAYEQNCLTLVDLSFAESLLGKPSSQNELTAAFLCHLFVSFRHGNICVYKKKGEIHPCPHALWLQEGLSLEVVNLLDSLIEEPVMISDELITDVSHDCDQLTPSTPLCRYQDLYYFQKYWLFEKFFIEDLKKILLDEPGLKIAADAFINAEKMKKRLNEEQARAIEQFQNTCFLVILGGPGTGKTYTAGCLVKIFLDSLSEEQKKQCKIVITAPTGKATANLQRSIEQKTQENPTCAKTLHALLNVSPTAEIRAVSRRKLDADLIIVDECSMIDVRLFSSLLASIKKGARLVLLGDPYQLPPVEVGFLFSDIIKAIPKKHIVELKRCHRTELIEIVNFSQWIRLADFKNVFESLSKKTNAAITKLNVSTEEALIHHAMQCIPHCDELTNPSELLDTYNGFRMLSTHQKGPFGVKRMNHLIHTLRTEKMRLNAWIQAPIIIEKNDYNMQLFNGEVGVIVYRKTKTALFQEGDFALFSGNRKVPASLLPQFAFAYCLSVHKSQGSEFDHVLLLLPEGSEKFGREVLYTGVTRAKRKLEIFASSQTLQKTLENQARRVSRFFYALSVLS